MKLFNYYDNNIDHTWFQSSNIVYAECIDKENELKTVKVIFSNGSQYEYYDVNVFDYLNFRDNQSQGKAFFKFIKSKDYKYEKLNDADLKKINEEYVFRSGNGIFLSENENNIEFFNTKNEKIGTLEIKDDMKPIQIIKEAFKIIGYKTKEKDNN